HSAEHHRHAALVRRSDHFLIAHRTARLDHAGRACVHHDVEAVANGKNASLATTVPASDSFACCALMLAMRADEGIARTVNAAREVFKTL
ncbi:MAG TPA: hypothetical protein VHL34_02620, partial [Rhizomicrobium sp.]|nr:hypothetical protein [Rhizomicrobium sp.]